MSKHIKLSNNFSSQENVCLKKKNHRNVLMDSDGDVWTSSKMYNLLPAMQSH